LKNNKIVNPITKEIIEVAVKAFDVDLDWLTAKRECEKLGDGWRLPTRIELLEINKQFDLFELIEDNYWSSTKGSQDNDSAGRVFMTKDPEFLVSDNKYWLSGKDNSYKVLPVKSVSKPQELDVLQELKCDGKTIEISDKDLSILTSFFEAKEGCEAFGNDWRMPTNKELEIIREKLHYKGIGGFKNEMYWSIVPEGAAGHLVFPGHAEGWFFGNEDDGPPFVDEEQDTYSCRPVRDKE
jgi:hypothetical protein